MRESIDHLFVYGTLRPGTLHPMARLLAECTQTVGPARVDGHLFDLGPYPGVALADGDAAACVHGDLLRLAQTGRPELLAELDAYEGCPRPGDGPALFRRVATSATSAGGARVPCWVYVYARSLEGAERVTSGDWLAHRRR